MPYTVWSNDRLIGESDLDYIANTSQVKFGDFSATEFGEQIITLRMAPRKAVCAHASLDEVEALHKQRESIPLELRAPDGRVIPTDDIEITDLDWLLTLAPLHPVEDDWQGDLEMAEFELREELEPEDRFQDPLRELLPPEWLDQEDEPAFDEFDIPDVEFGEEDAPPPNFPRYQIQVHIKHGG